MSSSYTYVLGYTTKDDNNNIKLYNLYYSLDDLKFVLSNLVGYYHYPGTNISSEFQFTEEYRQLYEINEITDDNLMDADFILDIDYRYFVKIHT